MLRLANKPIRVHENISLQLHTKLNYLLQQLCHQGGCITSLLHICLLVNLCDVRIYTFTVGLANTHTNLVAFYPGKIILATTNASIHIFTVH